MGSAKAAVALFLFLWCLKAPVLNSHHTPVRKRKVKSAGSSRLKTEAGCQHPRAPLLAPLCSSAGSLAVFHSRFGAPSLGQLHDTKGTAALRAPGSVRHAGSMNAPFASGGCSRCGCPHCGTPRHADPGEFFPAQSPSEAAGYQRTHKTQFR